MRSFILPGEGWCLMLVESHDGKKYHQINNRMNVTCMGYIPYLMGYFLDAAMQGMVEEQLFHI